MNTDLVIRPVGYRPLLLLCLLLLLLLRQVTGRKCAHVSVRLLVTDMRLALAVYSGIHTAYQYRLAGTGKWTGARNTILGIRQRLRAPFTRD